jgi:FtsX extracellular domain
MRPWPSGRCAAGPGRCCAGEVVVARLRALYWRKPGVLAGVDPGAFRASFRVRLDAPEHFGRLHRALCGRPPSKATVASPCMNGVEAVLEDRVPLKALLISKPWAATSDVTVFLPNATAAEREAVRARLEAIDGVVKVTYESPQEAYRGLPEKLRRDGRDPSLVAPLLSPEAMPAAFHVALDRPARVQAFHQALCGSRRTGACAGGLVVREHARRR